MSGFKIEITCKKCGSKNVETDLWMSQGAGLLHITCEECDNETHESYDDETLNNAIERTFKEADNE